MPTIIVKAEGAHDRESTGVMLRERVNVTDFESERFAANLLERLGWAVGDATELEHRERRAPVEFGPDDQPVEEAAERGAAERGAAGRRPLVGASHD